MILSNRIHRRLLYHHYWPLIGAVFFLGTLVFGAEYAEMGPESCELAEGLRGQFFRQANQPPRGPDWLTRVPAFERLILNKFSAFPWGKCVRRVGPTSFIFRKSFSSASKSTGPNSAEMLAGRPLCFRCFTLVQLGPNVVQCLHQNESICHKTLKAAERSCFDSAKVLPSDGALLFRHPPTKAWGPESACELLQGKFQLGYNLRLSSVEQKFECGLDAGSEMSTCADGNPTDEMTFRFRNCTFPNFEQHFQCLDSWPMNSNQEMGTGTGIGSSCSFIAVYNTATQEFRCGILKVVDELTTKLHLSVDSSCARLTPEGENALEEFTLRQYTPSIVQQSSSSSPTDRNSTCEFPLWLRGRQFSNGLRVGQTRILHQPAEIGSNLWAERRRASQRTRTTAAGQIASICVRQQGPERFLVQSAGKCGRSLGFHCLWFRMRSEALIEFRTTGIQSKFDELICDSTQFSPWTALLTQNERCQWPQAIFMPLAGLPSVACGLQGHFSTPKQRWLSQDCFSLDADCSTPNRLKLLAFQCQSGKVFDVSEFECLSSWREGTDKKGYLLYIFARRLGHEASDAAETSGICFASRESGLRGSKGIDFVLLGNNCRRQFDWESDEVLALKKKGHCEDRLVEEDGHQLMDFMAHDAQEQEMRQDGLSSSIAHTENEVPELIANGSLTRGVVLSNDGASAAAREFVIIIIVSSIFIFYFSDYFLI